MTAHNSVRSVRKFIIVIMIPKSVCVLTVRMRSRFRFSLMYSRYKNRTREQAKRLRNLRRQTTRGMKLYPLHKALVRQQHTSAVAKAAAQSRRRGNADRRKRRVSQNRHAVTGVLLTRGLLRLTESIRVLRWANIPNRNYGAKPAVRRPTKESG
jgi:galactokinase